MIFRRVVAAAVFSAFLFPAAAEAMDVSLRRVIFEGDRKSEILTIKNTSAEEQTYILGWQHYRMREVKGLEKVEAENDMKDILWADPLLSVEPERLTVKPGGEGKVTLSVKPSEGREAGEYRTHLWIRGERSAAKKPDLRKGRTQLSMFPAVSLPVFVRIGDMGASAALSDVRRVPKEGGGEKLEMTLSRQGNCSVFGDFEFICTGGGKEAMVKQVGGIAVYTETPSRKLSFALAVPEGMKETCKSIRVDYKSRPDDSVFKGGMIATAVVP